MTMQKVTSSNIAAIGWSAGNLLVEFKSGDTWGYAGVPQETYKEMSAAESVGKYFGQHIKGKYHGTAMVRAAKPEAQDAEKPSDHKDLGALIKKAIAGEDPYAPMDTPVVDTSPLTDTPTSARTYDNFQRAYDDIFGLSILGSDIVQLSGRIALHSETIRAALQMAILKTTK